jgi:serine/threonine-protein kinase
VRVLPRAGGTRVPGATVIELYAGELLSAAIRRGEARTTLHLPLDIAGLGLAADTIASAVAEAAGREAAAADPAARAHEMLLRARMLAQRSFESVTPAIALLEQAHALRPDEPRIAATLAMLCVRFVVVHEGEEDFGRARSLVRAALEAAPELADSHVAAGHLELHTGDPAVAAAHFRTAIACSPYVAEAHEGLGRMLLEAGFLDAAMARLDDALAIAPNLSGVRWEIARAHALEQNWVAFDALVAELSRQHDRPVARLRFAWWRGTQREIAALRGVLSLLREFEPAFMERLQAIIVEGAWPAHRDALVAYVLGSTSPSLRRRAFLAQLCAEAAGYAGDVPVCNAMIDRAVAYGLFDLHWLERCPLLEAARHTAEGVRARSHVKARAEAILDALYGDGRALSDTLIA